MAGVDPRGLARCGWGGATGDAGKARRIHGVRSLADAEGASLFPSPVGPVRITAGLFNPQGIHQ